MQPAEAVPWSSDWVNKEYFIASDATPIVEYTDRVIYLNNDDIALIKRDQLVLKNLTSDNTSI